MTARESFDIITGQQEKKELNAKIAGGVKGGRLLFDRLMFFAFAGLHFKSRWQTKAVPGKAQTLACSESNRR